MEFQEKDFADDIKEASTNSLRSFSLWLAASFKGIAK